MEHLIYAKTDKGDYKNSNDDSYMTNTALSNGHLLTVCAVCDGVGGLSDGYRASSIAVKTINDWFLNTLPGLITTSGMIDKDALYVSLKVLVKRCDELIRQDSFERNIESGTTLAALLILGNRCVTVNIGDSRVYVTRNGRIHHLTTDQTLVQRAIDHGEITEEEARRDPRKSILLQCIGTGEYPVPTFAMATAKKDDVFLICSDGFRNRISEEELENALTTSNTKSVEDIKNTVDYLIRLNRSRKEKDNITAVVVRILE